MGKFKSVGTDRFNASLGVHPVAFKVFALLRKSRVLQEAIKRACERNALADVKAAAWYNGRERGIVVYVDTYNAGRACVAFGEHRASDNMFVDCWREHYDINPPTYASADYEATLDTRREFPAGGVEAVAEYVAGALASGLEAVLGRI